MRDWKKAQLIKGDEFVQFVRPALVANGKEVAPPPDREFGYDLTVDGRPAECRLDLVSETSGRYFIEVRERWPDDPINVFRESGPAVKPRGCLWIQGNYNVGIVCVRASALADLIAGRPLRPTWTNGEITAYGVLCSVDSVRKIMDYAIDRVGGQPKMTVRPQQIDMFGGIE